MNMRIWKAAVHLACLVPIASSHAAVNISFFGVGGDPPPVSAALFTTLGAPSVPGPQADPGASTEWAVTVNLPLLQNLPLTVVLNLPDRAAVTLTRKRFQQRGSAGFLWTGSGADCSAVFSAIPDKFRGTVSCLTGSYDVKTLSSGKWLTRYQFAAAPPGSENDVAAVPVELPASAVDENVSAPLTPTNDQEVDVLILYTPVVRQHIEAQSGNVQQEMQFIMDTTQMAMDRSSAANTNTPIATVHLVRAQEVPWIDNGGFFGPDLDYLLNDAEPLALRNFWAADLVMLVRDTTYSPSACGLAYEPGYGGAPPPDQGFEAFAVGVTVRLCSFALYPFQHEFGHLFGANHDVMADNPTPLRPWAYAKVAPHGLKSARTLVSNSPSCGSQCTQVLNYSNAAVTVDWFVTGTLNLRENARVISEFAPDTAQYRASLGRIFADGFE